MHTRLRWFTIEGSQLTERVPFTNQALAVLPGTGANSLGAGPDGMLYAASTQIFRIDPDTGANEVIGMLPPGHSSSGDLVFVGDDMFISTDGPCGGSLVGFDLGTSTASVLGGDGLGCVYGLAAWQDQIFVVDCSGQVGIFDVDSGLVQVLSTTSIETYGADLLP